MALLQPWADFYGDSKGVETLLTFLHVGGLLLAGGFAISADRATLRTLRLDAEARAPHLRELSELHRWVVTGLTIIVASGLALAAADLETYWGSRLYWTKITLVVLLLANGFVMTRAERALSLDASEASPQWRRLRRAAISSLALWFATAAAGVALVNYS